MSEDSGLLVQFLLALGAVLILILLLAWILKKVNMMGARIGSSSDTPRLEVREAVQIDHRRRLVLVRRDHVEHLVMIGGENDFLVEHHIMPPLPAQQQQAQQAPRPQAAATPQPRPQAANQPIPQPRPTPQQAPQVKQPPALTASAAPKPAPSQRPVDSTKPTTSPVSAAAASLSAKPAATSPTPTSSNGVKPSAPIQPQQAGWQKDLSSTMPPHPLKQEPIADKPTPSNTENKQSFAQRDEKKEPVRAPIDAPAQKIEGTASPKIETAPPKVEEAKPQAEQPMKDVQPSGKTVSNDEQQVSSPVLPAAPTPVSPDPMSPAPESPAPVSPAQVNPETEMPSKADATPVVPPLPTEDAKEAPLTDDKQKSDMQQDTKPDETKPSDPAASAYDDEINRLLNELSGDNKK